MESGSASTPAASAACLGRNSAHNQGTIAVQFAARNDSFRAANCTAPAAVAVIGDTMAREVADPVAVGARGPVMGYEEWLSQTDGESRSEWVDGEVIVFMPTTVRHADLVGFLYTLLSSYVRYLALGRVFMETVEMRLDRVARVPDVLFVARDHLDRLTDRRLLGPADLVIELVSDDSVERDYEEKFREYAAAGVPEYWLLDARPGHQQSNFYHLADDGTYRSVPLDADGRYHSTALPGFWFRPDWLWRDPLPEALTCFAVIAPDAVRAALDAATRPDEA